MIGSRPAHADTEWFRRSRWNDDARELFVAKLRRVRDKAQLVGIQASYLVASDDERDWTGALEILAPFLDSLIDASQHAFLAMLAAQANEELGEIALAVALYRRSMRAMRDHPSAICNTHYLFARCVAENDLADLHDDALRALDDNPSAPDGNHLSRGNHFADLYARALIAARRGDPGRAAALADEAFAALGFSADDWPEVAGMSRRAKRMIAGTALLLPSDHPIRRNAAATA